MAGEIALPAGAATTDRVLPTAGQTTQRPPLTDLEQIMGAEPGTDVASLRARFSREYGNRSVEEVKQSICAQARALDFKGSTLGELRDMLCMALPDNPYAQKGMIGLGLGTVDAVWRARQAGAAAPSTAGGQDAVEPRPPDTTRTPVAMRPGPASPDTGAGRPTTVAMRIDRGADTEALGRLRGAEFARTLPDIRRHMAALSQTQQQDYLRRLYAQLGESERRLLLDNPVV